MQAQRTWRDVKEVPLVEYSNCKLIIGTTGQGLTTAQGRTNAANRLSKSCDSSVAEMNEPCRDQTLFHEVLQVVLMPA